MSFIRRHSRLMVVAVSCAMLGGGAGVIADAGASTGHASHAPDRAALRGARLRHWARHAVQGTVVVDTAKGFETVTFERGKVDSVAGQQLTITEGTRKASYKTVTLTVPSNAVVRDNRQKATLSALTPGQRVLVLTGPERTLVVARTAR